MQQSPQVYCGRFCAILSGEKIKYKMRTREEIEALQDWIREQRVPWVD